VESTDAPDRPIRVLIAEAPGWPWTIIKGEIARHPDEVEALVEAAHERLPVVFERFRPEVVLVPPQSTGLARAYYDLLRRGHPVHVLPVDVVAQGVDLYELRLLGRKVNSAELVATIREAVHRHDAGAAMTPDADSSSGRHE